MVSQARQNRWLKIFKAFDRNNDGSLTSADFDILSDDYPNALGLPNDDPLRKELKTQYHAFFKNVLAIADSNKDNVISPAEWVAWFAKSSDGKAQLSELDPFFKSMMESAFEASDLDRDNKVNEGEYLLWARVFLHWAGEDSCKTNFKKLAGERDFMDRERFMKVVHDLIFSDADEALSFFNA